MRALAAVPCGLSNFSANTARRHSRVSSSPSDSDSCCSPLLSFTLLSSAAAASARSPFDSVRFESHIQSVQSNLLSQLYAVQYAYHSLETGTRRGETRRSLHEIRVLCSALLCCCFS